MVIRLEPKPDLNLPPLQPHFSVTFEYSIQFTNGVFKLNNSLLAQLVNRDRQLKAKPIIAIIDAGVLFHHDRLVEQLHAYTNYYQIPLGADPIVVPGGEIAKNDPQLLQRIHTVIDAAHLCRHSYAIAIGGGAVLDLAGYAAATAHRGVRLIRIPTTVLAQNDSGVGVKNGINAFGKKNFLGTFAPPYAVINDCEFLTTLDQRDWRSGMAEAVKVALIKDKHFFALIEENAESLAQRDLNIMQQVIYRCAQLHTQHIAGNGDPFEQGSSRPLDFGHWAAHKLEQLTDYTLRHGEAVAIGIALDTTYSYLQGMLAAGEWQRVLTTFSRLGFTLFVRELTQHLDCPDHPRCLFRGLTEFREHLGGELTLTLLQGIGAGLEVQQVDLGLYKQAIALLKKHC